MPNHTSPSDRPFDTSSRRGHGLPLDSERSGTGAIGGGAFTPEETSGLRRLFGQGPEGARRLLDALDRGRVELPAGVGLATLERYGRIARDAIGDGKDRIGTQALRLQAIGRLREGRDAPAP